MEKFFFFEDSCNIQQIKQSFLKLLHERFNFDIRKKSSAAVLSFRDVNSGSVLV